MKNVLVLSLAFGLASTALADVKLPKIINSNMVLQRSVEAPIWGWADEGEDVTVSFAGQTKKATASGKKGRWEIKLASLKASSEPQKMIIKGKNEITLTGVLVGEVWLASGQSNMEWPISRTVEGEQELAKQQKDNNLIRVFHIDQHLSASVPFDDTIGTWKSGKDIADRLDVSAVAFFFALKLQKELGVPVAFIDANWGGKCIELFIPTEGYKALGLNYRKGNFSMAKYTEVLKDMEVSLSAATAAAENGVLVPVKLKNTRFDKVDNGIYNAMIAPVTPFAIKGAIWYQGESNRGKDDYFIKLQALSAGWSKVFNIKDIPIYQVQIAPFDYNRGNSKGDTTICDNIWTAQYEGAAKIPGMGVVAIHDTQIDIKNIHPARKKSVGDRLAAMALKNNYGKNVADRGPSFATATLNGAKVIVGFKDVDKGLSTTDGKAPTWFELSADGKMFVVADAVINGDKVEVSSSKVAAPKFVRMGWQEVALPTLNDKNGWPVFAFPSQPVK